MRKQKQYTWSISSHPMTPEEEQAFIPLLDRLVEEMVMIAMTKAVPPNVAVGKPAAGILRAGDALDRRRVAGVGIAECSATASEPLKDRLP
jgi:hypothetical protein